MLSKILCPKSKGLFADKVVPLSKQEYGSAVHFLLSLIKCLKPSDESDK